MTENIRPFPRSLVPLFQNESECETFHMKMSSACSFLFMQIRVIFHKNGFALRLALKQRHKGTRKSPIPCLIYFPSIKFHYVEALVFIAQKMAKKYLSSFWHNLVPRSLVDEAKSEIWQSKKICFSWLAALFDSCPIPSLKIDAVFRSKLSSNSSSNLEISVKFPWK